MGLKLSDVIVPELFNPYVQQQTMEKSALFKSGILATGAEFDMLASEAGFLHHMPFFADLTGDPENIEEDKALTADKITASQDVSTTIRRAKMWSATNLAGALSGTDPMAVIGGLVGGYWARQMQKELVAVLNGVFKASTMADHVLDISSLGGEQANLSAKSFIQGLQMLGDAQDQLTAVAMHSATKAYLKEKNLIATERDSTDVEFETYQGRRVIVDDGLPVDNDVYSTFLFGEGAIAFGNGTLSGFVPTEVDRDKRDASGVDYLINRQTFIMHPRGVKWTNASRANIASPTREELAKGENWELVYEPKAVRLACIKHKIG